MKVDKTNIAIGNHVRTTDEFNDGYDCFPLYAMRPIKDGVVTVILEKHDAAIVHEKGKEPRQMAFHFLEHLDPNSESCPCMGTGIESKGKVPPKRNL